MLSITFYLCDTELFACCMSVYAILIDLYPNKVNKNVNMATAECMVRGEEVS